MCSPSETFSLFRLREVGELKFCLHSFRRLTFPGSSDFLQQMSLSAFCFPRSCVFHPYLPYLFSGSSADQKLFTSSKHDAARISVDWHIMLLIRTRAFTTCLLTVLGKGASEFLKVWFVRIPFPSSNLWIGERTLKLQLLFFQWRWSLKKEKKIQIHGPKRISFRGFFSGKLKKFIYSNHYFLMFEFKFYVTCLVP